MTQLRKSQGAMQVTACAEFGIDKQGGNAAIVSGIKAAMRGGRFRGHRCVSCLTPEEVFIRNIRLPRTQADLSPSDADLSDAARREAQEKFGFNPATATVRFLRAGEVRQGSDVFDEVILCAAHGGSIDSHLARLSAAGLESVSIDVEPCALLRIFDFCGECEHDEARVFVDIGATTKVLIVRGHDVVFSKRIPIGGECFNRAIAEELGLAANEAELLRRQGFSDAQASAATFDGPQALGPGRPGELAQPAELFDGNQVKQALLRAMLPHLEGLANEIALCLRYYSVTFHDARPHKVTFVGGGAGDKTIVQFLGRRLDVDVEVAKRLHGISANFAATGAAPTDVSGAMEIDPKRGVRSPARRPPKGSSWRKDEPLGTGNGDLSRWAVALGLSIKAMYLPPPLRFESIRQLAINGEPAG
jgi:Tfp pilus assembly PilM family ATPase